MSTIAALVASRSPLLHIRASIPYEEYMTVCLSHSWDENAGTAANPCWATQTRKVDILFAPDSHDKERLLRVVDEYRDAIPASCLNITDAQEIYNNFHLTWVVIFEPHGIKPSPSSFKPWFLQLWQPLLPLLPLAMQLLLL